MAKKKPKKNIIEFPPANEVVVFIDKLNLRRVIFAELLESTDEIIKVKNPVFLNQQLSPKTQKVPHPQNPQMAVDQPVMRTGKDGKQEQVMEILTGLVPLVYPECLNDQDGGFILDFKKDEINIQDGILNDKFTFRYKHAIMHDPETIAEVAKMQEEAIKKQKIQEEEETVKLF